MRHLLRRNSRPGVYHGETHFGVVAIGSDGYSAFSRGEFHRVPDQVDQDLT